MSASEDSDSDYDSVYGPDSPTDVQDDIIIAVMGCTGSGKSSFIKLLTGNPDVKIGSNLDSETSEVNSFSFADRASGRKVTIVDTPGFDDSRPEMTDTDVLKQIADFLCQEYDAKRKLNGFIYVHRISDPRFGGQNIRNLRMFKELCGAETFKNVVILTTFWDRVAKAEGNKREDEMMKKSRFFKDLVAGGALFMRHDRTKENTLQVLRHFSALEPKDPRIAKEMRDEGKSLEETGAGSVRREEVEQLIAKHKQEVAELKAEMRTIQRSNVEARRALEEQRAEMKEKLARFEGEAAELKKGLDDERKSRQLLEAEAAKEREDREVWRDKQEREWASRLDSQAKTHEKSIEELKAELSQAKKAREVAQQTDDKKRFQDAERRAIAAERALNAERNKSFRRKGVELADHIPLVPNFLAGPILGTAGGVLDLVGRREARKKRYAGDDSD
ncbi:P-loop containing nucleoside triphosphate hydrolase protein [Mycena galericulata]|nr:P-loop containing nucleoside triphosphate hydrolase protein [Mycena galericulata]